MWRTGIKRDVDFSDPGQKRELYEELKLLEGPHEVIIRALKIARSPAQNRYWHGVVVWHFREFLKSQGQFHTHLQCHEFLRDKFADREPIFDAKGEVVDFMPASTALMGKSEFHEFVERVRYWLHSTFDIRVPDPMPVRERKELAHERDEDAEPAL